MTTKNLKKYMEILQESHLCSIYAKLCFYYYVEARKLAKMPDTGSLNSNLRSCQHYYHHRHHHNNHNPLSLRHCQNRTPLIKIQLL